MKLYFSKTVLRGLKNTSYLTIGNIFSQLVGLVGFVYIARYLGPENYGIYAIVIAFVGMFSLLTFTGINKVVIREGSKNLDEMAKALETSSGLKNLFSLFAILSCILATLFFPYSLQVKTYIVLFSFDLFYRSASSYISTIYQAAEVLKYSAFLTILNRLVFVSLSITVLYLGYGILYLFLSQIVSHLFTLSLNFYLSRKFVIFKFWSPIVWKESVYKPAIIFSSSSFLGFLSTKVDLIMLSILGTPIEVGIYGVAFSFSARLKQIRGALSTAFFPILVKSFDSGGMKLKKLLKYSMLIFVSMLTLAFFISYFAEKIIVVLIGKEYAESGYILSILVFNYAVGFSILPFTNALYATHNEKLSLGIESIRAVSNVFLNLLLYSSYGMVGIAYSTLITSVIIGITIFGFTINRLNKQGHFI